MKKINMMKVMNDEYILTYPEYYTFLSNLQNYTTILLDLTFCFRHQ